MKNKILYVHHAGCLAGAPKSLSYIIKGLDKNKYTPYLVNIERGPVDEFFNKLPVKILKLKGAKPFHGSTVVEKSLKLFIRNLIFLIPTIFKANRFIKKMDFDLIHLNSTCLFAFAIAAKWNKVKVVCHVREPLRKGIWGTPLRYFCNRFVDGFIAICENDLNSLKIKKSNQVKKEVIYNFVDLSKDIKNKNILREELKLKKGDVLFLYLARFSKSNGWKELISTIENKIDENENFHFVFVGAKNEYELNFSKNKNIHILPFREDVDDVLFSSDVFICPFVEPHFARGIIEASAHSISVLGTNIGGVNELIINNSTGFLYNSEEELIEKIHLLGNNPDLRIRLGKSGKEFSEVNFDLDKNLNKTYSFYSKILN
ncbi:glycosyltransferase family 4 protein [Polaribacter sp. 20A6]|uniref:glycosyltransferase family 4 protein n=1 Tax=Polaribacter sp. 20A6 TaxID=2687289 RepID=UPI0013FD23F7|nr:glycosyltransferase family 4 protein [Polaribacter sp. 20A6]